MNYAGHSRCYCRSCRFAIAVAIARSRRDSSEKRDSAEHNSRKRERKNGDRREGGRTGEVTEIRERQRRYRATVSRGVFGRERLLVFTFGLPTTKVEVEV